MSKSILIKVIYTLSILLTLVVVLLLLDKFVFRIKVVNLDSELSFSREITDIAGLNSQSSYLFVDTNSIKDRILKEPLVRKVFVDKIFPDSLDITVYGRDALAMAYRSLDEVSIPLCFDENGVLFQEGSEIDDINLPVISGDMDFTNVKKGGSLPRAVIPLLDNLKRIRGENPDLYSSISEISIVKKGEMSFDMVLYFTFTPIKALVGSVLTTEQLESIVVLNTLLQRDGVAVDEVDFRSKEIVYREKG